MLARAILALASAMTALSSAVPALALAMTAFPPSSASFAPTTPVFLRAVFLRAEDIQLFAEVSMPLTCLVLLRRDMFGVGCYERDMFGMGCYERDAEREQECGCEISHGVLDRKRGSPRCR